MHFHVIAENYHVFLFAHSKYCKTRKHAQSTRTHPEVAGGGGHFITPCPIEGRLRGHYIMCSPAEIHLRWHMFFFTKTSCIQCVWHLFRGTSVPVLLQQGHVTFRLHLMLLQTEVTGAHKHDPRAAFLILLLCRCMASSPVCLITPLLV